MAVSTRAFSAPSNNEVRTIVVTKQDKEMLIQRLPKEVREIVSMADNIFDFEEIVARMVESKMPNTVIYCKEMVLGRHRMVPYFYVANIADQLGYEETHLRHAYRNIPTHMTIQYSQLVDRTSAHNVGGLDKLRCDTTFATYDGIMELLSKTRKFKDKADELKLAIKSIHQLTRDITESLYVLKLEYEATQKDAHITTLTRKIDDMSIQIEQLLTYGKSSNQMLENISSRVIVPITQQSHQEVFILLHLEETRYYTIRAQERAAKTATDRIYSMYPNARKVLTIYGNANSVSTGNAMRKDLKKAGASVNGNDIDIGDAFDEKALVNYINKLYKNRLK
jgi:hypothetical protein